MSDANRTQIGGDHYRRQPIQPWDYIAANNLGFFEGNAIKYLTRWRFKHGVEDLRKARHYIDKLLEIEEAAEKTIPTSLVEVKENTTIRSLRVYYWNEPCASGSCWMARWLGTDGYSIEGRIGIEPTATLSQAIIRACKDLGLAVEPREFAGSDNPNGKSAIWERSDNDAPGPKSGDTAYQTGTPR